MYGCLLLTKVIVFNDVMGNFVSLTTSIEAGLRDRLVLTKMPASNCGIFAFIDWNVIVFIDQKCDEIR